MRAVCLIVSLLPCAFAQIESDTLTIRSSRSLRLQPDQVIIQLLVTSNLNSGFEDVVAALSGLEITAANLTNIEGGPIQSSISWSLNLTVPYNKLKTTVAALTLLRQMIMKNNKDMMLEFGVLGSQVSSESMRSHSCSIDDLVADARLQAEKIAASAELIAGPILAMSDGNSSEAVPPAPVTFDILHIVDPVTGQVHYPTVPTILTRTAPDPFNCTAEIKFKLLRYQ